MGLVNYSDSENSDYTHEHHDKKPSTTTKSSQRAFGNAVVERSETGKTKILLPPATLEENEHDEPPKKKLKLGNDTLGSFNSFLPAPKRSESAFSISGGAKDRGLPKTRDAQPFGSSEKQFLMDEDFPGPDTMEIDSKPSTPSQETTATEGKAFKKPQIFKPLSVSRRQSKKMMAFQGSPNPITPEPKLKKHQKISLFSFSSDTEKHTPPLHDHEEGNYQPVIYDVIDVTDEPVTGERVEASYENTPTSTYSIPPPAPTPPVSGMGSLYGVAADLNLTPSEWRQLIGRKRGDNQATKPANIISFDTDQEYSHNEELRAVGQQVVHNPVRAIAPGKHSLKQLVNAAQSQKEALEESFAKGKSNRAEASSRYGW